MKRFLWPVLLGFSGLIGCGGPNAGVTAPAEGPGNAKPQSAENAGPTENAGSMGNTSGTRSASLVGKPFETEAMLAHVLSERGLTGALALYDTRTRKLLCSAEGACDVALGPASTFKIPHTLIGLELGELTGAEHFFKWDGKSYSMEAWNQDHTLRSAMEVSCVPCFQQLARRIGEERMTRALGLLGYGNATLGGAIDEFWLEPGGLRITPREQIEFLYRLQTRALPMRADVMETTIDVIPKVVGDGTILRGKTGMLGSDPPVGWYVGWLEWERGVTYFSTALHGEIDPEKLVPARRAVTVEALRRFTKVTALE